MVQSSYLRFGIVWAILVMLGFILGAIIAPPDAITNFRIGIGVIPVGAVIGYLVVFRMTAFASGAPDTK